MDEIVEYGECAVFVGQEEELTEDQKKDIIKQMESRQRELRRDIEWTVLMNPKSWDIDEDSGWVRGDR